MVKASLNEVRSIDFIEASHLHTSTHRYETVNRVDVLKFKVIFSRTKHYKCSLYECFFIKCRFRGFVFQILIEVSFNNEATLRVKSST